MRRAAVASMPEESSRRSSSNAQCEQFNCGNPECQNCERYRIVFKPDTHDILHSADRDGRWPLNYVQAKWFIKVIDALPALDNRPDATQ